MKLIALLAFAISAPVLLAQVPTPPSTATWFTNIEKASGWTACSSCTGNPGASYWFKQWVSSPSMDGDSMETYIKSCYGCWGDNLFVHYLGNQTWAHHVEFSQNFLWNASKTKQSNGAYVVQAIEFDARMINGDFKYMFGTQCDYAEGHWDVWNGPGHYWEHTGVACQKWGPNSWHNIKWYGTIDYNTKYLKFVGLAVDGKQYWINKTFAATPTAWSQQFLYQYEQDTDYQGDPWYMWSEKVNVAVW